MEDLARAGFSWHSNPGCLRCRSAAPLICQRFPPGAVGSGYSCTRRWGPGGEDGCGSVNQRHQQLCRWGMAHSVYRCSPRTSEQRCCPFPEQSTGDLDLSGEVSAKYSLYRPALTFVLGALGSPLCQNFGPLTGRKWGDTRKVQLGLTTAVPVARQLTALPCFRHSRLCLASGSLPITVAPVPCFSTADIKSSFSKEEGLVFEVSMPIHRRLLFSCNKNFLLSPH